MDHRQLVEFITLAESKSFSAAARKLYLSQSTLSSHIAGMEKELGFDLVEHGKRSFTLTRSGKAFLDRSHELIAIWEDACREGRALADVQHRLKVYTAQMPANTKLFQTLKGKYGELVRFIDPDMNENVREAVESGKAQIGITFDVEEMQGTDENEGRRGACFERLGSAAATIAVHETHPLAQQQELLLNDLQGKAMVLQSHAYFRSWRKMIRVLFGEEARIDLKLMSVDSIVDFSVAPYDGMMFMLPSANMSWYFGNRNDLVFFNTVDGVPLRVPYGVIYSTEVDSGILESVLEDMRAIPLDTLA